MAERSDSNIIVGLIIALLVGAAVSWAGSDGGAYVGTVPLFAICGALAFAINWLVFLPSALAKTEHFYDLTGGLTYITVIAVAVYFAQPLDLRAKLVAAMVMVWSVRLASFLFLRISKAGKDSRFDVIKTRPLRFLLAWTLQGLWVLLTAAAALAIITGGVQKPLGIVGIVGIAVWAVGMLIEIIADRQKSAFRADEANDGRFITTGLWAWSRHPNYFGEITLWLGIAILATPALADWQIATLISPLFVFVLLTRISGVPLLERRGLKRWGDDPEYQAYLATTPVLMLRPPNR